MDAPAVTQRAAPARIIAIIGALMVWLALVVQLVAIIGVIHGRGGTTALAIWRYFGYFTILTNILVAATFTHAALRLRQRSGLGAPRSEAAVAVAIILVGLVNVVVLRRLTSLHGIPALLDHVLHDASPILFALFWLLRPHGSLRWGDALWCLILPLAYCLYALARGAADGWYPYPFIDAARLSIGALAANVALLAVAFAVAACALVAVDRWLGRSDRG